MDIRRVVGLNVRKFREKQGWSQEDLADRSGIHRTYISGVERGIRNPTVMIVSILAGALGVTADELLGEPAS